MRSYIFSGECMGGPWDGELRRYPEPAIQVIRASLPTVTPYPLPSYPLPPSWRPDGQYVHNESTRIIQHDCIILYGEWRWTPAPAD